MSKSQITPIIVIFAAVLMTPILYAQEFSAIMQKFDELETRLEKLEKKMGTQPGKQSDLFSTSDITSLKQRVTNLETKVSSTGSVNEDIIEDSIIDLAVKMDALENQMNSFGLSSGNPNFDSGMMTQLQTINNDLNSLKTQMQTPSGQPKSSAKTPTISGLLGTELMYNDNADETEENEFKLIYGRVTIKGDIADNIGYQVQADFSRQANDMLLDGYVHLNPTFNTKLTIGQFYTNYSTINTRSSTRQRFISKPVANARISPPTRDIGATLGISQNEYSATVGVFNGAGQNQADPNKYKNLAGRITYKLSPMLAVSGNAYYGKSNDVDSLAKDMRMYNGGAQFAFNQVTIEGEYSYGKTDQLEKTGYFVDIWYEYKSQGIISSITPGGRFDWYDPNIDQEDDIQIRYTGGIKLTFTKLPNMSVLANYEFYDTENIDGNDKRFLVDVQLSF